MHTHFMVCLCEVWEKEVHNRICNGGVGQSASADLKQTHTQGKGGAHIGFATSAEVANPVAPKKKRNPSLTNPQLGNEPKVHTRSLYLGVHENEDWSCVRNRKLKCGQVSLQIRVRGVGGLSRFWVETVKIFINFFFLLG